MLGDMLRLGGQVGRYNAAYGGLAAYFRKASRQAGWAITVADGFIRSDRGALPFVRHANFLALAALNCHRGTSVSSNYQ